LIRVLTIRELQEASGVSRSAIHYYLSIGLLPRPQKTSSNRSLYTEHHLQVLLKIAELKAAGLSLAEVQDRLVEGAGQVDGSQVDLARQEYVRMHERILGAAAQSLVEGGHKSVRVADIVKKLGITTALFYSHFSSKQRLLAECVGNLMNWSLECSAEYESKTQDGAERILWLCFGSSHVFRAGATALALTRVEETGDDSEPIEEVFNQLVCRIAQDLGDRPAGTTPPDPALEELIARSLFGAYEETMLRTLSDHRYTQEDVYLAHLWLVLAIQAARNGEVDIDSRLDRYRDLVSRLSAQMPPLPPILKQ